MRMYKGEAEILKTELTKMLNTKHKRVVAEFGKAVGKEVRKSKLIFIRLSALKN